MLVYIERKGEINAEPRELLRLEPAVAVLGKIFGGPGPSSFGRQQRLSEIYYRTN